MLLRSYSSGIAFVTIVVAFVAVFLHSDWVRFQLFIPLIFPILRTLLKSLHFLRVIFSDYLAFSIISPLLLQLLISKLFFLHRIFINLITEFLVILAPILQMQLIQFRVTLQRQILLLVIQLRLTQTLLLL